MKKYIYIILGICLLVAVLMPFFGNAIATPIMDIRDYLGSFTGPGTGVAQDDNIKASLDLAHTDLDAILADTAAIDTASELQTLAGTITMERSISKSLASIANGANNLFAVTGGPIIMTRFVMYVTTGIEAKSVLIGGNIDPTTPATDTVFGTDGTALEINGDAAGTVYSWDGVLATDFTATTNGVVLDAGTDVSAGLIVPPGMIELTSSAAATGAITVYMSYIPLCPASVVTAQ